MLPRLWRDVARVLGTAPGQRAVMAAAAAVQLWTLSLHPPGSPWQLVPLGCLALLGWAQVRIERFRRHTARLLEGMRDGARPQGVVVRHANGTTTPVELVYLGRDEEGVHVWGGATPLGPGDAVHVAVMPPRSAVSLPMRGQ